MANAAPQSTSSHDTRCHFFRLSLELRDSIHDYVAYGEKEPGLHINAETVTEPKAHVYAQGLSHTCTQVRQEYVLRLLRRVKQLVIDLQCPVTSPFDPDLDTSHTVLVEEHLVSKGVWLRDLLAFQWDLPFIGTSDRGARLSTLTFTVASSEMRTYNDWWEIPAGISSVGTVWGSFNAMRYPRGSNATDLPIDVRPCWPVYEARYVCLRLKSCPCWLPGVA